MEYCNKTKYINFCSFPKKKCSKPHKSRLIHSNIQKSTYDTIINVCPIESFRRVGIQKQFTMSN